MAKTKASSTLWIILAFLLPHNASAADNPTITTLGPLSDYNHLIVMTIDDPNKPKMINQLKQVNINLATGEITITKNLLAAPVVNLKKCTSPDLIKQLQPLLKDKKVCVNHHILPKEEWGLCLMIGRTGVPIFVKADAEGDPLKEISIGGFLANNADQISKYECDSTYQICDTAAEAKLQAYAYQIMSIETKMPDGVTDFHCEDVAQTKPDPSLLGNCMVYLPAGAQTWEVSTSREQCEIFCRQSMKRQGIKSTTCEWDLKDGKTEKFEKTIP